jgi:uncharacterized protein with ParB-like and HNH nuclease domain
MIKSANKYNVSDIFKTEADIKYVIPKYQREYTWGKWQWEALFDDIQTNGKGHFIGSIICIDQSTDALETSDLEVVDGQQRLTTLSLLYAAIYSVIEERKDDLEFEQQLEQLKLKQRLILKKDNETIRLEPSFQNHNYSDYKSILKEAKLIKEADRKNNAGNRKLFKSYRYFRNRLSEQVVEKDGSKTYVFSVKELFSFLDKIGNACLVKIEVSTHSDAFTLFESLNNRGVPLSAIDLIKNKLLAKLEMDHIETLDRNFNKWNNFLQFFE